MGGLAPRVSEEQRKAIVTAVLDEGLSAEEAVRRAAAGELGTPAFEMPLTTARGLVTRERTRRTKQQLIELERQEAGSAARIRDQALYILEEELTQIEERQHEGEEVDLTRVRRIAKSAREIQRLSAAVEATTARSRSAPPAVEPDLPSPELQSLLTEMRREAPAKTANGDAD